VSTIRINLDLSQRHADVLRTNTMREFVLEQDGRFEHFDGPDEKEPRFRGCVMHWCATASDWLLLRAYEQARGFEVVLLSDLAGVHDSWPDSYALLTSEPFDQWCNRERAR
jgi:hypothetical protein